MKLPKLSRQRKRRRSGGPSMRKLKMESLEDRRVLAASFDAGFGTDGIVSASDPSLDFTSIDFQVDSSGNIFAGHLIPQEREFDGPAPGDIIEPDVPPELNLRVDRFNPDGTFDSTLSAPVSEPSNVRAVAIADDDAIFAVGVTLDDPLLVVAKWDSNGILDTSFGGGDGFVEFELTTTNSDLRVGQELFSVSGFVLHDNGDITLGGVTSILPAVSGGNNGTPGGDFQIALNADGAVNREGFLIQLDSTGSPDLTFGDNGHLLAEMNVTDVEIDASDLLVVAGYPYDDSGLGIPVITSGQTTVQRYDADGLVDTSFGDGGTASVLNVTSPDTLATLLSHEITIGSDGSIFGSGTPDFSEFDLFSGSNPTTVGSIVVYKLTDTGVLDTSFSDDGIVTLSDSVVFPAVYQVTELPGGSLIAAAVGFNTINDIESDINLPTGQTTFVQLDPSGDVIESFGNGEFGPGSFSTDGLALTSTYRLSGTRLIGRSGFANELYSIELAPVLNPGDFTVDENTANGTIVDTVTTVAQNSAQTFAIVSGDPTGVFTIDPATGDIAVADSAALDFESPNTSYTLNVEVVDAAGLSDSTTVTIAVNDVNEAPSIAAGSATIDEGSPIGTAVHTVIASDPDSGDVLSFAINGGNTDNAFVIDTATGDITVNDPAALEFDVNPVFTLTVDVTDSGGLTTSETVTVTLQEIVSDTNVVLIDGELIITGSDGDDGIVVRPDGDNILVTGLAPGTFTFPASEIDNITINGGDGDDNIRVFNAIVVDAVISGGAGNDIIRGGGGNDTINGDDGNDGLLGRNGNDIVIGGEGNDILLGNAGRDILIGGDQADILFGGDASDILIGGLTNFQDDLTILNLIRDEWTSDRTVNQRAFNLFNGVGEVLDGTGFRLRIGETIFSDGDNDPLFGGNGLDWLL